MNSFVRRNLLSGFTIATSIATDTGLLMVPASAVFIANVWAPVVQLRVEVVPVL